MTLHDGWMDLIRATRGFMHVYCPEQLVFFGFVLGVTFTGVAFILAN